MKKYPYTARFAAFAKALPVFENQEQVATAALNDLANVFKGDDTYDRIANSPDLLFWASNLILLDHANLNDDALRKEDGLRIYKQFILKLLDIEHNRSDIVGSIYEAGFSLFPSNKLISFEDAAASTERLQLVVGGYIWRIVAPELCDHIEMASMETSSTYGDVSTSFELSFEYYDIGVGPGGNRDINAARIVKRDDPDFKMLNKVLRANKGSGKLPNGDIVYRILAGDILPLGAGVVAKPASGLKGIYAITELPQVETEDEEEDEEDDKEEESNMVEMPMASTEIESSTSLIVNIDPNHNPDESDKYAEVIVSSELNIKTDDSSVTNNTTTLLPMKIKSLDELAQNWTELKKLETVASVITDLKEVAQASTRAEIEEALAKKSEEFAAELQKQKDVVAQVEANKIAADAESAQLKSTVAALQAELQQVKAAQLAKAAEDDFDKRMGALDQEFDLDDEDRAFIVEEVRSIENDEAFAKYMSKQKKLMAGKKKKAKAEFPFKKEEKKEGEKKGEEGGDCGASVKVDVAEVVASVQEKPGQAIPNTVVPTESVADRVRKVMGESVTIGNIKASDLKK